MEAKAELDAANLAEAKSAEAKSAKAVSKAEAFPPPGINDETRHRLESEEQFSNFLSDCKRWIEAIAKHSGGLPALIESTQRDRQLAVDQEVKSIDDDEKKLKGHESRLVELRNELKLNNDKIEENQKLLESSVPDSQSQDGDESQMPEVNIQATELQGIINKLENDAKVMAADIKKLMSMIKNLRSSLVTKGERFNDLATELNENEDCPETARTRALISGYISNLQLCRANRQRTIDVLRKQERFAKIEEARTRAAELETEKRNAELETERRNAELETERRNAELEKERLNAAELAKRVESDALHRALRNRVHAAYAYDNWVPAFFVNHAAATVLFEALTRLSAFCRSRYGTSRKFDDKYKVIWTLLQYLGVNGLLRIGGYVELWKSFLIDFAQLGQYKAKLEGFATDQKDSDCYSGENNYNLRNVSDLHEHMQTVVNSDSSWQEVLARVPEAETLVVDASTDSPPPGSPTGTVILGVANSPPGVDEESTVVEDVHAQQPDYGSPRHYGQELDVDQEEDEAPFPHLPCDPKRD